MMRLYTSVPFLCGQVVFLFWSVKKRQGIQAVAAVQNLMALSHGWHIKRPDLCSLHTGFNLAPQWTTSLAKKSTAAGSIGQMQLPKLHARKNTTWKITQKHMLEPNIHSRMAVLFALTLGDHQEGAVEKNNERHLNYLERVWKRHRGLVPCCSLHIYLNSSLWMMCNFQTKIVLLTILGQPVHIVFDTLLQFLSLVTTYRIYKHNLYS